MVMHSIQHHGCSPCVTLHLCYNNERFWANVFCKIMGIKTRKYDMEWQYLTLSSIQVLIIKLEYHLKV